MTATTEPRDYRAEREAEQKLRYEELENIKKFHVFLQGVIPEGVTVRRFKKMNAGQAFSVIWFLQECCHLLPEQYEMCCNCDGIYDSHSEGHYDEKAGKHYCGSCE